MFYGKSVLSLKLTEIEIQLTLSKGVFTWHRGDFRPGASSLRLPL